MQKLFSSIAVNVSLSSYLFCACLLFLSAYLVKL